MNLEYFYNACRKNIVTSIAQSEAVQSRSANDLRSERPYDELVALYFLVYDASLDDDLLEKLNDVISKFEAEVRTQTGELRDKKNRVMLYLISIRDEWNDLKNKKTNIISSIKYPIIISAGIILYALFISTYYSFDLVNNISAISLISVSIFIFIVLAFLSLIYISKYIYYSVNELK